MASVPLSRNREFVLLWTGQALSGLGSQVSTVAYPLLALALTGSPAKAGIVGFAKWIPTPVFALPGGMLADRVNRKHLMVGCDGLRALAMAWIALSLATGGASFGALVVVAFIDGAGSIVTFAAERGALRHLVPAEQLREAAVRNETRTYAAMLAGPPLGGVLFAIGRVVPFLADALSFAASTTSKLLIRAEFQESRSDSSPGSVWDGVRWIWQRPFFRTCSILWAATSPVLIGSELLVVVLAKRHHASSGLIGLMLGIAAAGGLLGALLAPRVQRHCSPRLILAGEVWVIAAMLPLLLIAHNALLLGVIYGAATMVVPVSNSVVVGYRIALAPDRLQGRVNAASALASLSAGWAGPLVVGVLLQSAGPTAAILILTGWSALLATAASASRAFRDPPVPDGAARPASVAVT